jgi:phosphomannomutase
MERSGHAFIKRRMIEEDCLLGCEVSGHYFFRELRGGDDGLFAALLMSELVSRSGPLGDLRKSLAPIFATPDLRFPARTLAYPEVAKRLRGLFPTAQETTLDGLRLEMPDGFVLARESVTEPVVTMRLEGFSEKSLRRLIEICLRAFPEVSKEIVEQVHKARES